MSFRVLQMNTESEAVRVNPRAELLYRRTPAW
jgi:hypothetical protein